MAIVSSSSSSSSILNDNHHNDGLISDYLRKPTISKQHYLGTYFINIKISKEKVRVSSLRFLGGFNFKGQNLQICFMNEANNEENALEVHDQVQEDISSEKKFDGDIESSNKLPNSCSNFSVLSLSSSDSCDNILAQLQVRI